MRYYPQSKPGAYNPLHKPRAYPNRPARISLGQGGRTTANWFWWSVGRAKLKAARELKP